MYTTLFSPFTSRVLSTYQDSVLPNSELSMNEKGMPVTLGSNFFIGAWAMVMLYDYHNGEDFAKHGGARQKLDYLTLINKSNSSSYFKLINDRSKLIDFRRFSKHIHPSPGTYEFSLKALMRSN